jgi:methylated-DNA-[protein]-cysteine S-methyltransferase
VTRDRTTWWLDRLGHPQIPLWIAHDADDALVWIAFADPQRCPLATLAGLAPGAVGIERRADTPARRQLLEYLAGRRRRFSLPTRARGTAFQREAWQALTDIPYGRTRSYGQQAAAIDKPAAVRAVGRANGVNPLAIVVPCHRVIGGDGGMTGFGGGIAVKRWLLELERRKQPPTWSPSARAGTQQLDLFG